MSVFLYINMSIISIYTIYYSFLLLFALKIDLLSINLFYNILPQQLIFNAPLNFFRGQRICKNELSSIDMGDWNFNRVRVMEMRLETTAAT